MNKNITSVISEKIERADIDFSLFRNTKKILVGLSGGADSVCLLLCLDALSQKYGFEVCALHINHKIREKEADRDEEFSRNLCKKLGIEFFCETIDIPSLCQEKKESTELVARNERYRIFQEYCKTHRCDCVATAHTQSDSTETVLFNLVRGSGLPGLCGIPAKRQLCDDICIIRPLIYVSRNEIEAFLEQKNQDYVTDSSNLTDDYTRNFIRNNVIPSLKTINPSLEDCVLRLSRNARHDNDFLTKLSNENFTDKLSQLCLLDYSILSRIIIRIFSQYSNLTPSEFHIRRLCDEIYLYKNHNFKSKSISFTDCYIAKLEDGILFFKKDLRLKEKPIYEFEKELITGENFFEGSPFALYLSYDTNKETGSTLSFNDCVYTKYSVDYLYSDKVIDTLYAKNRRQSDVILSNGMHKKIKRLLNCAISDKQLRDFLPLICDKDGNIILIPSVCVNDEFKTAKKQGATLCITLYKKETQHFKE